MMRVMKNTFRTSKTDLERLFACNRESAKVWNDCLAYAKDCHKQTGKWISKKELQAHTKGRYHLHSQSIQSVQERYILARDNTWKAKQAGHVQIRYPYKNKKHYPTRWKKDGFVIQVSGRTYNCYCGYSMHRDNQVARNILAKYKYGEIHELAWQIEKTTYLRPTG